MNKKKYLPIEIPRDYWYFVEPYPQEMKDKLKGYIDSCLAEGKWQHSEDILFDETITDVNFLAYSIHKSVAPLKNPMPGHGLEQAFAPFKKKSHDFLPAGFQLEKNYTFAAVGDLMATPYLRESADKLYERVETLMFDSDLLFGNLESSLTAVKEGIYSAKEGEGPKVNVDIDEYNTLVKHKGKQLDVVQLTNNHVLDCGFEGIDLTMKQLKKDGIVFVGAYETEADAGRVKTTFLDDIKIGWVSHTFSFNGRPLVEGKEWLADRTRFHCEENPDTSRIEGQIAACREAGCDLIVLALHWGQEHEMYPHPDQLKWAHQFAELGADVIIGHHPHVCQPVEIYTPKSRPNVSVPIMYSLGNVTPPTSGAISIMSMIARIGLAKGTVNGERKVSVARLELTPVAVVLEQDQERKIVRAVPLIEILASDLDADTREYFNVTAEAAELVLGKNWSGS